MAHEVIDIVGIGGAESLHVNAYTGNITDNSKSRKRLQFNIGRDFVYLTKEMWEQLKETIDKEFI